MQWAVSTCEFTGPHRPLQLSGHSTTYNPTVAPSWEYFITLEYEWGTIRGHHRYRWTIWVRINIHFTLVQTATSGTDLPIRCLTDLLPCTSGRPRFRSIHSFPFEQYRPNQLSGGYHVRTLATLRWALTAQCPQPQGRHLG